MSKFWETLLATPAGGLDPLSRYVVVNGWFYVAAGAALLVAPRSLQELLFFASLDGYAPGFVHVVGMTVAIIGWFYVIGGRTGQASFALATVVDRLLVPLVLIPLALLGHVPLMAVLPFAILDPVLAIGALLLWRRSVSS